MVAHVAVRRERHVDADGVRRHAGRSDSSPSSRSTRTYVSDRRNGVCDRRGRHGAAAARPGAAARAAPESAAGRAQAPAAAAARRGGGRAAGGSVAAAPAPAARAGARSTSRRALFLQASPAPLRSARPPSSARSCVPSRSFATASYRCRACRAGDRSRAAGCARTSPAASMTTGSPLWSSASTRTVRARGTIAWKPSTLRQPS